MIPQAIARLSAGRVHYAWITLAVMFTAMLSVVGVRAAPGVMIIPLQRAFGWDVSTISAAVSINILLLGLTGPLLTGLIEVIGLKRTILSCMLVLLAGVGLSTFMTEPWQLFLTWGVMVGVGVGAGAIGIGGAIANRWFAKRTALAMGLLTSANAAGQLIFLPLLAALAQRYGWQGVSIALTGTVGAMMVLVFALLPESPEQVGLVPFGAAVSLGAPPRQDNPFAVALSALGRAGRSVDFWLLTLSFAVCGFSTNGLVNTHFIAYCADNHIPEVSGAGMLAVIGVFSLMGSAGSGWLCDRYNPRVLLFWYYGLRGLSLVALPFTSFDVVSLSIFSVFYGLDWVATGPATFAVTNEIFGRRQAPVIIAWIFVGHQAGGALAALGAGAVRSLTGTYFIAFVASGIACFLAAMLVLRVRRVVPALVPAQ
ncbi:MAG TPA: MFS transporter [Candidatus Sulfotelmatobacter sp.]|nr:MFS transporter [Candidatus Sulfotelmatobacter sp.]